MGLFDVLDPPVGAPELTTVAMSATPRSLPITTSAEWDLLRDLDPQGMIGQEASCFSGAVQSAGAPELMKVATSAAPEAS